MAKITVGPVIGKVTDTSARVLIEVDVDVEVTCAATDSSGNSTSQKRAFKANIPSAFVLTGLHPDQYIVTFQGVNDNREGKIRTFPANPDRMNIAAVSCNFTTHRGETDLWSDLRDRYVRPGDLDLVLHMGDQIYADSAFAEALHSLRGRPRVDKNKEGKILEMFRRLYRYTWNYPPTQEVLASVSNLMIWDDHEIRDNWGSFETDSDPDSDVFYIGTLARQVYREYQRQLWADIDPAVPPASGFEHHFHTWGPIGVLFVDQRGGRSFQRDSARPYLGTGQWSEIEAALNEGGAFSSARALLVITSVPLVYLSTAISAVGSHWVNDLRDHWSYGPHRKEQLEMIRALRTWKEADPGNRELLVIGGDVHVGGYTEIKHQGSTVFRQLISSPITQTPPKWYEFYGIRILSEVQEELGTSYSFEHSNFTNRRNFGVIIVRVPSTGLPRVEGSLVEAV